MENRRDFLGALAAIPVVHGVLRQGPAEASTLQLADPLGDADVFSRLRGDLLFPREVTYCNTGTLGAVPRAVMDAMVNGLRHTEAALGEDDRRVTPWRPTKSISAETTFSKDTGSGEEHKSSRVKVSQSL